MVEVDSYRNVNLGMVLNTALQGPPSPRAVENADNGFNPNSYATEILAHGRKDAQVANGAGAVATLAGLGTLWAALHASPLLPVMVVGDLTFGGLFLKKLGDLAYGEVQMYRINMGRRVPKTVR